MAKTTVKRGQTYGKIADQIDLPEAELRALNPGVKTLKPGQVINLNNRAYNQENFQTPTSSTPVVNKPPTPAVVPPMTGNQAGYQTITPPMTGYRPPTSGLQTPSTQPVQPQSYTGTAGYYPQPNAGVYAPTPPKPITQGFQTPTNGTNRPQPTGFQTPTSSTPYKPPTTTAAPVKSPPLDDKGKPIVYTGDPKDPNTAIWKAYWNDKAKRPQAYQQPSAAPRVMTRSQIWEMKAAQRRRRIDVDQTSSQTYEQPQDGQQQFYDPELYRTITWGI